MNETLPPELNKFCIECANNENEELCNKCLNWPRERPLWELRGSKKKAVKRKPKEAQKNGFGF